MLLLVAAVGGCTSPPVESSRNEMKEHLGECTRQFGYDPSRPGVAENQLAPGERQWRACAYAAIERHLIPRSLVSESYSALIADDRRMTDGIENGALSRSQRRLRLEAALDQIDLRERELQRQRQEETRRTAQQQAQQTEMIWQMQQQAIMASQMSAVRAGLR